MDVVALTAQLTSRHASCFFANWTVSKLWLSFHVFQASFFSAINRILMKWPKIMKSVRLSC